MEGPTGPSGAARDLQRRTRSDPPDEPREPNLGSSKDPRRVAQTRYRHQRDLREQVHGPLPEAAITDVANLLGKSHEEPGIGGLFHGPTLRFQSSTCFWCWLMTDAGSSTSALPPTPPRNGLPSNSATPS